MTYLVSPEGPDQLPITTPPSFSEECNHKKKSSLSKHLLVVNEASRLLKILQDRYLAKLMARRRVSFAICYITFKTKITFKEHMQMGASLLESGPTAVKVGFGREIMLLLDGISGGPKSRREIDGLPW